MQVSLQWTPPFFLSADAFATGQASHNPPPTTNTSATLPSTITYDVYIAPNGFPLNNYVPTTVCGLQNWAQDIPTNTPGAVLQGLTQPSVVLGGLDPAQSTWWQVAVVANCNASCWAAYFPSDTSPSSSLQSAAYPLLSFTYTSGGGGGGDGGLGGA